jgi:hypothetical protein
VISARFDPAIPATKRPQTYALDRGATGTGKEPSGSINQRNVMAKDKAAPLHAKKALGGEEV